MKFIPVILVAVILLLAVAVLLWLRAARNMALALVQPPVNPVSTTPAAVGVDQWEEVTFASGDLQLGGWFIPPAPAAAGATLVLVHGWQGNRTALLAQAAMLHRHGYGALLIDLRHSGSSQGELSTWGYTEADDVQAAVEYLLTRPEVNPDKIGLLGFSTGGAAVTRAAARLPQIKVVVIDSTYTALTDNLANVIELLGGRIPAYPPLVLWFMERETGLPLREVRPVADVAAIAPRPIMLMQGEADVVVNPSHTRRLFDAASEPKQLYLVAGAGHGESFSVDPAGFERQVVSFLDSYLREQQP